MKNDPPNPFLQSNQKPHPPSNPNPKFVYSKEKFSSPQFFLRHPIDTVNQNLLSGIFSPQPRKNTHQSPNLQIYDKTAENKNPLRFSPHLNNDADLTSKPKIPQKITVIDSFHITKTNLPKKHHNFAQLQSNPNEQNQYQKESYLRHRRILSEPKNLGKSEKATKQENGYKNVRFNEQKIKTNIGTLKRQVRKRLQRSTSSSILKNKHKKGRIVSVDDVTRRRKIRTDETISILSDQIKEDPTERAKNANIQMRKKYENIVSGLVNKIKHGKSVFNSGRYQKEFEEIKNIKEQQKFTDLLFPGNNSSVFGYNKLVQMKQGKFPVLNIKWLRIPQLFPQQKLVIFDSSTQSQSQISVLPSLYGSYHLASAMNAIKNCKSFLTTIFQSQAVNELGIYILKIFQQNVWKFIIIDDKIPVIENQINGKKNGRKTKTQEENAVSSYIPAFLKLGFPKNASQIQIWPLLVEKAYASLYSSYETFHIGNSIDYLQEITGTPRVLLNFQFLNQSHQQLAYLQNQFKSLSAFGLGEKQKEEHLFPILSGYAKGTQKNLLVYCDWKNNFQQISLPYEKIPFQFTKFHFFSFHKYPYLTHCFVGHYKKANLINKSNKTLRAQYSLRSFSLEHHSDVLFSMRQKEKMFYENSSFKYQYIWVRVILVQKEFKGDYRWITGKYSCQKSINFQTYLSPGHYCLIIMPEWRQTHSHELNLFLWSNLPHLKFVKQSYDPESRIIEKASMDLAQRKGKLSQVNAFICSYNYLNEDVGMIIENINNQRTLGSVKVMRSINGLKASVDIIPINKEFYEISEEERKKNPKKFKNNITINIAQESSFTVVLKMKGGIDNKFFQVFDFGN